MESSDPYGRAIRDHYLGEREEPLVDRDGADSREHPIEAFYFGAVTGDSEDQQWVDSWLDGPLLDMGAGVGSQALYWQDQFETVAIDVSAPLVETMRDRGVEKSVQADMFALRESFERGRFRSAHAAGTQLELAGSMQGSGSFWVTSMRSRRRTPPLSSTVTTPSTKTRASYSATARTRRRDSPPGCSTPNTRATSGRRCSFACSVPTEYGKRRSEPVGRSPRYGAATTGITTERH
jgi:hypothetical protein